MKQTLLRVVHGALLSLMLSNAQAGVGIPNGGFETGDLSGWTLTGDPDYNWVDSYAPHSGAYSAVFGAVAAPASIGTDLSTEIGHTYALSFWLANLGAGANVDKLSTFEALAGGNSLWSLDDKSATGYTEHVLRFTATASTTALLFRFQHDDTYWLFDDVAVRDVTNASPVPEPSQLPMLLLGLSLFGLLRRRSR